jgi:hypothetical protein
MEPEKGSGNSVNYRRPPRVILSVLLAFVSVAAISVNTLRKDVDWLTDPTRDGRKSRTTAAAATADYIGERFKQMGFEVRFQDFGMNRRNVVAKTGDAEKHIVLGSHYDGQGTGYPSASDNAAGIAALLELARELKAERLPVSLVVIAFDDEEQGLNGSRYYSENPLFPLENASSAIIFDTMGRSFIDLSYWAMFVLGTEYSRELSQIVGKRSNANMLVLGTDLIGPRSDFAPFAVKRVPYLFFSHGTHKDYHGTDDTPQKINYRQLSRDVDLIAQIVRDIARSAQKPSYLETPVYPPGEKSAMIRYLSILEKERPDLPAAYRMLLEDMRARINSDMSRDSLRVTTAGLLAVATPRLSSFLLTFILGPFYERENKPTIATAIYEEALKWTTNPAERRELEQRITTLRSPAR